MKKLLFVCSFEAAPVIPTYLGLFPKNNLGIWSDPNMITLDAWSKKHHR
jgi:hypothetical protein